MAKKRLRTDDNEKPEKISLRKVIHSDGFSYTMGVCFWIFALFMVFAFSSYLATWWADYDALSLMVFNDLFNNSQLPFHNIASRIGAFVAHSFIYKGFGIASYLFILLSFAIGCRFLRLPFFKLSRLIIRCSFFIVWTSILIGLITYLLDSWSLLGGVFGYETVSYLNNAIGISGTILLLIGSILVFLSLSYNLRIRLYPQIKQWIEDRKLKARTMITPTTMDDALDASPDTKGENTADLIENTENAEDTEYGLPNQITPTQDDIVISSEDEGAPFVIENPNTEDSNVLSENSDEDTIDEDDEDDYPDDDEADHYTIEEPYDPYLDLPNYKFPTLDLLEDYDGAGSGSNPAQNEELMQNKKLIETTLKNFGVEIAQIKATIGPTVTLYEIVPAPGVRISKIQNLENDIALNLAALGIRIIAPMPGKGTIGIEVPNQVKQIVPMKTMLASSQFKDTKFDLPIALGKTIQNEYFIADLAKMPHMLMAGATGQGKSVGLNAIIASLLYKKHPADLKMVMVDPKKVELTLYNKIERHYLAKLPDSEDAIITDTKKVVRTLNSLCKEMDNRYDLLKDAQCKNIKEYNTKFIARRLNPQHGHRYLPYIVLIVDEFADLIMTAGKEVELPISRLAQLARAIGIHLIIATQRPSVNIITGTIKANFPARIAFRVTSKIDSRTILDSGGADQLIGRGDMLLSTGNDLVRLQCALVDTPEIERIADFIGEQRAYGQAYLLPEIDDESVQASGSISAGERDAMFEEAAQLIISTQIGSTSLIQRKLKLGYARSGRIMDELEDAGIVGPSQGSKPREVYIKDITSLEEIIHPKD
ncbi:DNA translocase FtsK [Bacteroidia bacterium]|nr:DNA translocase FtsK [Bacteroidia bacterium]